MSERKEHPWYSFDKVLSYNAFWCMVCGGRGLGKTYGAKRHAIRKAVRSYEKGEPIEQFIYLRRFKDEVIASAPQFFADIALEFPDYDFKVHGKVAMMAPTITRDDKKRDWYVIGFFVALSQAQSRKGVSYHQVTTIIFDEFILEKTGTQYLPNEAAVFQNFYSTVDRWQDKTRVFMLANAVSINNPYMIKWKINPDIDASEIKKYGKRKNGEPFLVAHFPEAADFQESVYNTAFGQWIADTEYADYAVGNTFGDNNDHMIGLKDPSAVYMYSVKTKAGSFSVWRSHDYWYVMARQPRRTIMFTTVAEFMDEGLIYLTHRDPVFSELRTRWRQGVVKFDEPSTRNAMLPLFER